jgi:hypothetical protein
MRARTRTHPDARTDIHVVQQKRAPIFEPAEEHCKFLLDNKAMTDKALVAAFNAEFGPVRATADGRRRPSGPVGGRRAHPRADGVAPVQAGVTINLRQLRGARPKCDPEHTLAAKAANFEPSEEHCEFLRANRDMTRKKLLAAFNAKFGPVRATADG